jgi:hypothetical protein
VAVELEVIDDADDLYRRLARHHVREDGRVSSSAFKRGKEPDPEVSVNLARLMTYEEMLRRADLPDQGVGVIVARVPLRLGLTVRHDPVDENPAHSVIEGQTTRAQPRQLAEATGIQEQPA